jgi:serine/threonine protein kinase
MTPKIDLCPLLAGGEDTETPAGRTTAVVLPGYTAVCTLARGCAVRCNFGENEFAYAPPSVELPADDMTPWCAGAPGRRGCFEYFCSAPGSTARWRPVENSKNDEFAVESSNDMFDCVVRDTNADMIDSILTSASSHYAVDMHILCHQIKDPIGRTMLEMASSSCRRVLQSHFFFLKRFEFVTPKRPEHVSDTCIVMLCWDHLQDEEEEGQEEQASTAAATASPSRPPLPPGSKKLVALKLMKNHDDYLKEVSSRVNSELNDAYVARILDCFDGEADDSVAKELEEKGFANYKFCIVMHAADRSLERILAQENIAGKDWSQIKYIFIQIVNCVSHMHTQNVLHADLKPLNIMRTELGHMILIDLDASMTLPGQQVNLQQKFSGAYCPPEWAAAVTGTTPAGSLVAYASFDLWPLGAILFHLVSGEPLFLSNQSDNIDAACLQILCDWTDGYKQSKLQKICDPLKLRI